MPQGQGHLAAMSQSPLPRTMMRPRGGRRTMGEPDRLIRNSIRMVPLGKLALSRNVASGPSIPCALWMQGNLANEARMMAQPQQAYAGFQGTQSLYILNPRLSLRCLWRRRKRRRIMKTI
jgi:hypothetical protein